MDEQTYKKWWPLHLRVAKGEKLSGEERTAYEAGLKHLHDSEEIGRNATELSQARTAVQRLTVEQRKLQERQKTLDEQIVALEKVLDRGVGEKLAVKE